MTGHGASVYSLAFSAESSLLVSAGADCTVRCWDIKSAGGLRGKPRENGTMGLANSDASSQGYGDEDSMETYAYRYFRSCQILIFFCSIDLMSTFPTKRTPITNVQFTPRNLCLVAGAYPSPELR